MKNERIVPVCSTAHIGKYILISRVFSVPTSYKCEEQSQQLKDKKCNVQFKSFLNKKEDTHLQYGTWWFKVFFLFKGHLGIFNQKCVLNRPFSTRIMEGISGSGTVLVVGNEI